MAAISSAATGNWSIAATWVGSVVPTAVDDVTIVTGHTVTIDLAAVALSVTINGTNTTTFGVLTSSLAATSLTVQNGVTVGGYGKLNIDVSASAAYGFNVRLNAARSTTAGLGICLLVSEAGGCSLKGFPRKRITTLSSGISAAATTATVVDASGWQVGDTICFATTGAYAATPLTDLVTLTAIVGNVLTWIGGVTNAHAAAGYVGNFTSNLNIGPNTANDFGTFWWRFTYGTTYIAKLISHVAFNNIKSGGYPLYGAVGAYDADDLSSYAPVGTLLDYTVQDSVVYGGTNTGFYIAATHAATATGVAFTRCIVYSADVSSSDNAAAFNPAGANVGSIVDCGVFRFTGASSGLTGFACKSPGSGVVGGFVSGVKSYGVSLNIVNGVITNTDVFSNLNGVYGNSSAFTATGMMLGTHNAGAATNGTSEIYGAVVNATYQDCLTQTLSATMVNCSPSSEVRWVDKNNSVTTQEKYRSFSEIKRNNSLMTRSTSSISIKPLKVSKDSQHVVSIPCANGSTIVVVGYCQVDTAFYNAGTWTAPTAIITGLSGTGTLIYTATSAASGAWQKYTLTATNNSGADGNFTLTLTANASTVLTGTAYFSGVPSSPFITKARHYGYLFDQTTPDAIANPTIFTTEATAAAYTGITIAGGAVSSSTTISANQTFQYLYDYSQAWACLNLGFAVPITGAGVAGSPILFAQGNITINTTFKLNGSGSVSIAMGVYLLTTEFTGAVAYTYTGGSWSQLTSVPTFNGGQANLGAAATLIFSAASVIISMTPTAASTYNFGGGTFTGVTDLRNTTALAITVQMPAGSTTTTANNVGGVITVTVALPNIVLSNVVVGSEIRIADGTNTQIYLSAAATSTITIPTSFSGTAYVTVRLATYVEYKTTITVDAVTGASAYIVQTLDGTA
jgi:hypothetical protein